MTQQMLWPLLYRFYHIDAISKNKNWKRVKGNFTRISSCTFNDTCRYVWICQDCYDYCKQFAIDGIFLGMSQAQTMSCAEKSKLEKKLRKKNWLSEKLASLGIIGVQLMAPFKPIDTIALWWSEMFPGALNWTPLIAVVLPVWWSETFPHWLEDKTHVK